MFLSLHSHILALLLYGLALYALPVQIPSNLIEAEFMVFSSRGQFPKTEATQQGQLLKFPPFVGKNNSVTVLVMN